MKNWLLFVVTFCLVVICKGQVTWHQLGYEYYIHTGVEVTNQAAVNACTSMNATLARIKTKQVQDFVMEKIKLLYPGTMWKHFYIGLNRINSSSTGFQWNDGTMVTSGYTNWRSGEPNNGDGNENCVVLLYKIGHSLHGKWNDLSCLWNRRYICERRVEKDTTTQQQTTTDTHTDKTTTVTQRAFTTTTTNNDPLEQMKTSCEFSTIHVVMSSLGSIVGTSVVFIIGILIYCKKRRNHDVTAPSPKTRAVS
ncbi:C-type lectin domain family 4 member E-like [Ciona intestinalis]